MKKLRELNEEIKSGSSYFYLKNVEELSGKVENINKLLTEESESIKKITEEIENYDFLEAKKHLHGTINRLKLYYSQI